MKLSKKTLVTVFLLTVCFATVFAQTLPKLPKSPEPMRISPKSMTNESTKELFGTDVDDYLDVNGWSNVKPEKVFGFLSYGKDGNDKLNFGLAGPVAGKFYLSGFFGGQLNSWTSKKETEQKGKNKNKTTTTTTSENTASGSLLFGFDNIGIMGSFTYKPGPSADNNTTIDTLNKTKTIKNKFDLEVALKAGMNIKGSNDMLFKTFAELALTSNVNKTRDEYTGSPKWYDITNKNEHTLQLNGGVGFDFAHNGPVTQGASFALNTAWKIYPTVTENNTQTKDAEKVYGKLEDTITLDPAWQLTYEPEESKVALKVRAGLPITFKFKNQYNYKDTITGGSSSIAYNTARVHTTGIGFRPEASIGLTYAPVSKFRFNLGAKFNVPTFGWAIKTTKHRNGSDGKLIADGIDKTITWQFNSEDGKIELGTGFTWLITQNITFDAHWNLSNVLNNFRIDFSAGNIWDKLGQFIGNDIGFLLSVKL